MKKIKSIFLKIKAKQTLKTYQKPLITTIVTLLILNLIIIFAASIIAYNIDPGYFNNKYLNSIVHFLSCMLTANTITKLMDQIADHIHIVFISIVVIATELVLFSGAVIATLTAAIRSYIDKKSNARGKLELENHFVILNWNSKVPDIIYNLMEKDFRNNVIIVSEKNKDYIHTEIDSLISSYNDKKKRKLNLIVKVGNPLLHGTLDDISIEKASNIIIMSREDMEIGEDENITNHDLYSLKIMLALGNFAIKEDCNIVIETDTEETKNRIENLTLTLKNLRNKSIIPTSFNRKIGQIIAQTMIEPALANIYLELLSYRGCEFYSFDKETVEEYLVTHNNGIPIIRLNQLFVLAEDEKDLGIKRNTKSSLAEARRLKIKNDKLSYDCSIFVIGDNKKGRFIRENLDLVKIGYGTNFEVHSYEKNDTETLIKDIKNTPGIKRVLILSDDTVSSDSYDANVFVTLIALQSAFSNRRRKELSFVTELLDSKNLSSINDFNIKNAIISNRMMSLLLTQLALNKDSKDFFDGLLTTDTEEGGDFFDIVIEEVGNMVDDEELVFKTKRDLLHSFYVSFDRKYMLLGYIKDDEVYFIPKNQDKEEEIKLTKEDSFIFIKY